MHIGSSWWASVMVILCDPNEVEHIGYGWIKKKFHMPLTTCAYIEKEVMFLAHGIERSSDRPCCGWN